MLTSLGLLTIIRLKVKLVWKSSWGISSLEYSWTLGLHELHLNLTNIEEFYLTLICNNILMKGWRTKSKSWGGTNNILEGQKEGIDLDLLPSHFLPSITDPGDSWEDRRVRVNECVCINLIPFVLPSATASLPLLSEVKFAQRWVLNPAFVCLYLVLQFLDEFSTVLYKNIWLA